MKNKYFLLIFTIMFILFTVSQLGRFLDVTIEATKSDILVSLGGDNGNRIKRALFLYNNGYSESKKLIITGVDNFDKEMSIYELDWRANYLIKKGIKKEDIIFNVTAKNTLEEIFFIKKYMIDNKLSSVAIISDAPHSKRINFFANTIANYKKNNIELRILSSENSWWDKSSYFRNPEAIIFAINEVIKLTYYYINYKLGKYDEY